MKKYLSFILSIFIISSSFPQLKKTSAFNRSVLKKHININQIDGYLNNLGQVDYTNPQIHISWKALNFRDFLTGRELNGGFIVFDQGLWIMGKINNEKHAATTQWSTSFSPGPIINNKPAMLSNPEDSLKYTIYKITKGDNNANPDYANWPINFGAPIDKFGKPLIKGDQTLWTVFNSADSSTLKNFPWFQPNNEKKTLPIEIQQLVFARKGNKKDNEDIFSNVIFYEYTIINKGNVNIDSTFIGLWTDIDFDELYLNPPAVDTSAQVGYSWYSGNESENFFTNRAPPAIGYTLLYGPSIFSAGDTSIFKGRKLLNHKNLPLNSFHGLSDDTPNGPFNMAHTVDNAWNIATGLLSDGLPNINPSNGKITKFQLSGDPITNTGWIYPNKFTDGGAGFVMFTGPFNLAPQDTQWVMIALTPALGNDRFESIKLLREKANLLRSIPYDSLAYGTTPYKLDYVDTTNIKSVVENEIVPNNLELSQNFPNPFNPETTIKYGIPKQSFVTLKIYDVLGKEIKTLVNENKKEGTYRIKFNSNSLASGVYLYRLTAGNLVQTKKMILLK